MKNVSKILCLLMALSMLLVCFAACNNDKKNPDDTSEETTAPEEDTVDTDSALYRSELEVRDFKKEDKQEFTIWYSTKSAWSPYPLYVDGELGNSGDIIYSAGYKRNDELETLVNISMNFIRSDSGQTEDAAILRNLAISGDIQNIDMVMSGDVVPVTMAMEGFFLDLNQTAYVKPLADYYEAQVNEQLEIYGKQYFASGFYSVMNTAAIDVTWVNADIVEDSTGLVMTDLYDLALNKKWTINKLLEIGSHYATPDANTGDYLTDKYGFILSRNYCQNIYFDLGGTVVEYDDANEKYAVTVRDATNIDLLTWTQTNITKNTNVSLVKNDDHYKAFFAEAAPFLCCTFMGIWQFLDSDMAWGTLPAPLMNEGDDYIAYSDRWNLNFAGIPAKNSNPDAAAYLYELFMCLSYDHVYPAYYESCFGLRYQPDEVGSQIFDIVAHSRKLDLANMFNLYTTQLNSMIISANNGVSSTTRSINSEVKNALNTLLNTFESMS